MVAALGGRGSFEVSNDNNVAVVLVRFLLKGRLDNAENFFNDNPTSDKSKVAMIVITFERGSCKYYISAHG
ncbi:hypothetical protein C5167_024500 [Papaver somniferum]|uniref:Uncharacterized protein n=1 Tax=Papaver somniferum TaxID=3469 RepID=A0A4Y7JSE7_PAPSO|nr:hypothetical protein C5167_024500 [Papaver somniferum]